MTQEEKAKAYDEALERAKGVIEQNPLMEYLKKGIEYILSELKESEDERVRKELKSLFLGWINGSNPPLFAEECNRWIAWLEKQGEQKPIMNVPAREVILSIWNLGNEWKELTNGSISTEYGTQLDYIQKHWQESEYYLREKQGEQKPADKVEPKFHEGDIIIHKELGGDYIHNPHKIIQVDILDKKYRLEGGLVAHFGEQEDYELVEQKQEWSESDKEMHAAVLQLITDSEKENGWNCVYCNDKEIYFSDIIAWLKSLGPQNRWKPSERQKEALLWCVVHLGGADKQALGELLEELNKL